MGHSVCGLSSICLYLCVLCPPNFTDVVQGSFVALVGYCRIDCNDCVVMAQII